MAERGQREAHAHHAGDLRAPDRGAAHDDVGGDLALVGEDAGDTAVGLLDVEDFVAGEEGHAAFGGPADLGLHREDGFGEAVGGDQEAAEDPVGVHQRVLFHALFGAQQAGLDAPRGDPAVAAAEFGDPLGGGGDLEAADLEEAGLAVDVEGAELLDRVAGQLGHGLGGVGLEDQPGRVRGGAAGGGQRALVDHGHLGPASRGDLVRECRPTTPAPMMTTRGPAIAAPPARKQSGCCLRNMVQVAQLNVPVATSGCQGVLDVGKQPETPA